MQAAKIQYYSVAEYLTLESASDTRHEYLNGEVVAMTGVSAAHNQIIGNLYTAMRQHLKNSACRAYFADMKLEVAAANCFFYPDLLVVCNNEIARPGDYYFSDAKIIVEVLSGSTEQRDKEFKRLTYQHLDGLQEYLLVQQNRPAVTLYRKLPDGWEQILYSHADEVELKSIALNITMISIYEDIEFKPFMQY